MHVGFEVRERVFGCLGGVEVPMQRIVLVLPLRVIFEVRKRVFGGFRVLMPLLAVVLPLWIGESLALFIISDHRSSIIPFTLY